MSVFKRTSKYRKLSTISEKEKFLNAELRKTGMLDENAPANSTGGIYSVPIEQENEKYTAINAITYGGKNIVFHHVEEEDGIKSPDGTKTAMTNAGWSQMTKTRPGWRSSPQHRMHGTVIWYWDPTLDNIPPEPDGGWVNLEWGVNPHPDYQPGFGYWTSGGLGFLMHSNANVPADLKSALADYASEEAQEELKRGPTHIVLDRQGTNDMFDPYPGDKDKEKKSEEEEARAQLGLGQSAWDWLKDQVTGESEDSEWVKELDDALDDDDTETDDEEKFKEALNEKYKEIAKRAGISLKAFQWLLSNNTAWGQILTKLDDIVKGDSGIKALDKLLDPIAQSTAKALGKGFKVETAANVMLRYDKYLANGETGTVDVSNEVSAKDMKKLQKELHTPGGYTPDEWVKTFMNQSKGHELYAATREEAFSKLADDIQGRIKGVMTKSGTGLSMTFQNNVQLDKEKYIASGGKVIEMTKTYKFAEGTGSVKGFSDTKLGHLLSGMGVELDRFGTGNKAVMALVGSKYGLRHINRAYDGKADSAPGMPMRLKIPNPNGQQNESYLSEGWQSPEHVNVDKNERKRWFNPKDIQPEYPEKAPPEQVDGWHPDLKKKEETPISIKQYIKIKEVDLIKNHKLKDNEVKEFTKTINAINSYLTKNPSALVHAQQRYPRTDPHLAALNYKMDTMLSASKDFMDKKYPENTRLFNQLQKSVKKSIKLTDPSTFKVKLGKKTSYKKLLSVNHVENIYDKVSKTETKVKRKKNKKSAARFFRKEKSKTKSELIDLRLKQLEIDMQKTLTNP